MTHQNDNASGQAGDGAKLKSTYINYRPRKVFSQAKRHADQRNYWREVACCAALAVFAFFGR
jgi:hypothetical protein